MMSDRTKVLLDKVYDELEKVDVSTLKFDEMKDFLGVVQAGQFLESSAAGFGFGNALYCNNYGSGEGTTQLEHTNVETSSSSDTNDA